MQKQSKNSKAVPVGTRILIGVAAVTFVSSAIVLGVLGGIGYGFTHLGAALLVAALLAVAVAPSAHWLVYLPTHRAEIDVPAGELSAVTITDPLTHVMNRRGITMGVLEAMAQAERYNTPLSVAMVDVDHFQRINDEYGHSVGDKVLADLAGVLADSLRMPDKVGRYEGEEFMVVLPHTPLTQARKIAERIRSNVAGAKISANGKREALTVSIGVTQYAKGADLELLWSRAAAAVAEAKRDDGNRVVAKKGR